MCGITGYYSPSGKFNQSHLQAATDALMHRGPDAGAVFTQGKVGLGHRRLSILDLSTSANQPMVSANNRFVIAYNGEVYNFKEIELEIKKYRPDVVFKTHSDTEIILEAFSLWRENIAEMLNGMFAIAIYDKDNDALFLFRDRLGIKPIYFYWDDQDFFFASELKGLKALKNTIPLELNEKALPYFFHLGFIPEPHSIFKNIYKFPAGNYLKLNKHGFELNSYWEPQSKITKEILTNETKAKQQLKDLVESSVKYRMICDVPFGTFLSGGIDSSLVTAVAQSLSTSPVQTFSIGIDDKNHNESEFAEAVAKHLKTNHHTFTVKQSDALQLVSELDGIYDEPFADTSAIPTLMVSKLARKHVTMTLSGDGGDELFMGYGAYKWARRLSNPLLATFKSPISAALNMGGNRYKRVSNLFKSSSSQNFQSNIFSQEQNMFYESELTLLMCDKTNNKINIRQDFTGLKRKLSASENQAVFDLMVYLKDDLLVKVDRATMHHSLETRVPLLDYRITEFALNLDESLKLNGNTMKYLLKQVLYDYVPESYFNRPKKGFSIPLNHWMRNDLRPITEKYVNKEMCERYGIIEWAYAKELLDRFYNQQIDFYYNRLWLIQCIHKYMETNF